MFIERPSSWYDPPDEPSDAEEEACYEAWKEYLRDCCEKCDWVAEESDDNTLHVMPDDEPCEDCEQHRPQEYSDWRQDYHEFAKHDAAVAAAEARADEALDRMMYDD